MKRTIILSFLVAFVALGFAQEKSRLTPELLWKFGRQSGETVSPDGKAVLYGITYYDLDKNKGSRDLYIMAAGEKKKGNKTFQVANQVTRVTMTPDINEYDAVWRPDGQKIGFLSAESGSMQLWEISPDGSGRKQITDIEGGIANFAYAPDMKHISFTKDVKLDQTVNEIYKDLPLADARIIDDLMYRHWNQWHDYAYSHLHVLGYAEGETEGEPKDIMENERYDTPLNPFGGGEQITWAPDGKSLVYTCKKKTGVEYAVSTNSDLYHYDIASGKVENLTADNPGYDVEPIFSPDGKWLAWSSMARDGYESDKNRIMIMDLATRKKVDLTRDFDDNAGGVTWSADGKTIYFTAGVGATYQIFSVDVATAAVTQLTHGDHNFYSVHVFGDKLLGQRVSISEPAELYEVDIKNRTHKQVTFINKPILEQVAMGKVEARTIKTTDGKDMKAWVIYPPGFDPNQKYPTILYCQGGPQSAVSQFFSYRWNFQLMAAHGYIIVAPNRRGLPSFGTEWNEAISGDWGGQPMDDYLSAIDDVAKEPWSDENRLAAVGASYGGYSVYYLAGNHDKRFKAFISHCGLYNLEAWYGATEELFFANFDLKGAYWDNPTPPSYAKFSPHKYAKNWDTPMLVIHGAKDFRVPETEGMQAFTVNKLKGIPSRFLYFPEEGHWVQSPQNGILWHRVFFDWLKQHLK